MLENFPEKDIIGLRFCKLSGSESDVCWHRVAPQQYLDASVNKKYGLFGPR